jgi:hypothetical protein
MLHVVAIKSRDAIAVLGRMVEQLPKRDTGHRLFSVAECGWVLEDKTIKASGPVEINVRGHRKLQAEKTPSLNHERSDNASARFSYLHQNIRRRRSTS